MRSSNSAAAIARAVAASAITRVVVDRRYLDVVLSEQRAQNLASPRDWPLIQELSYGTLRWYHQLHGIAALLLARPLKPQDADVHALLLVGLYQLRHMRVAQHAAVDATVEAARALKKPWAKNLINACLRSALRQSGRIDDAVAASDEIRLSHPAWLIAIIRRDFPDRWEQILDANNQRPPMTLRVNLQRYSRAEYLNLLDAATISASAHPQVASAVVVHEPVPVERLPGFFDGAVSVQDAAAQLAAFLLDTPARGRVLDACAAPGGKAAHLLEHAPSIELTAIDIAPQRLDRVRENFARLGLSAQLITADVGDTESWWDGRAFDRILIDAPCSATGVIRRHPDIKTRREPADLPILQNHQSRLLDAVWPCLASGGKLLYATCSILTEENSSQVRSFLARHPDAVARPVEIDGNPMGRQIVTGDEDMDGFFYASIEKR